MADDDKYVEYLKRVTGELRQTRRKLREVEDRGREPIAIVAMSCRFPGGIRTPRICGGSSTRAATPSAHCPTTAAGTSRTATIPTPTDPGPSPPEKAASCTTPPPSTPPSSA